MTDQHRYEFLGGHGCPNLKTPHIDALMQEGVDFRRTYSQTAICMPSRVTVFSGQYLHTHGIQSNSTTADMGHLTLLPALLRDAGYATAMIGKNHAGHHAQIGFEHARICAGEHTGENNDYLNYLESHDLAQYWYGGGRPSGLEKIREYMAYTSRIPYRHSVEAWTGDESIRYLRDRDKTKPFFLWTSFERPHPPICVPTDNPFPYDPDAVQLPPYSENWYNLPESCRPGVENIWNVHHTGEGPLRQAIANYMSLISMIDDQVGRIVAELAAQGELENTLIVFTADHGEFAGENGQFGKNVSTYDVLYRVPLVWYWKGKTQHDQFYEPTELTDVMPTILDLCGLETPRTVQGRSMAPAVLGSVLQCNAPWQGRDAVFFETPFVKTVRTRTHKLSVCWRGHHAWGMLFDLEADPHETRNLYDRPEYAWVRHDLELRLLRWFIETQQPQRHGCGRGETPPSPDWRWFRAE